MSDAEHFESYGEQTRTKHQILRQYLPPYLRILAKAGGHQRLLYIDGFAGRGFYVDDGEEFDGSPLLVCRLAADSEPLRESLQPFFIEADEELFDQLDERVSAFFADHPEIQEPAVLRGTFADCVGEILEGVESLAPTFMFVDPCGVKGVEMDVVAGVLRRRWCEVLVFFNYAGVNRILGLEDAEQQETLLALFGDQDIVSDLVGAVAEIDEPHLREEAVVAAYLEALGRRGEAQFVVPFRVEAEKQRRTSHYLIHGTKSPLGFKIMKDIMWKAGDVGEGEGRLELLRASRSDLFHLDRPDLDELREQLLTDLGVERLRVGEVLKDWVERPEDLFTEGCYKRIILDLEADGAVRIVDAEGTAVTAKDRGFRKGQATLGPKFHDHFIELA